MIQLVDYCEANGLTYNTAYQGFYKADKTGLPPWIKKDKSTYYIDDVKLSKKLSEEQSAWSFATTYTYWWLIDWIGFTEREISHEIAKRSKVYRSADSWYMFIRRDLFNLPTQSIYSDKRTMLQDFVVYGTAMCLAYYRDNY